jgi:signal transduction histidine kinase
MRSVGEVALQTNRTSEEYREVIGSMLEESSRLTRLVDSLLFLSRAESNKYKLHQEAIDLLEFVQATTNMMRILAEEKEQRLEIEGPAGVVLHADRVLLSQALLNLIDNAIKFSPRGTLITIGVGRNDEMQNFMRVTDAGPGIPTSERDRIFDRFYRVNKNGASGAGLGLAIARWAVEAHGGTIRVDSKQGAGSTFLISLPPSHEH